MLFAVPAVGLSHEPFWGMARSPIRWFSFACVCEKQSLSSLLSQCVLQLQSSSFLLPISAVQSQQRSYAWHVTSLPAIHPVHHPFIPPAAHQPPPRTNPAPPLPYQRKPAHLHVPPQPPFIPPAHTTSIPLNCRWPQAPPG